MQNQRPLFPKEYADPVFHSDNEVAGIVGSHSLIPNALFHAFRPSALLVTGPSAQPQPAKTMCACAKSASTTVADGLGGGRD